MIPDAPAPIFPQGSPLARKLLHWLGWRLIRPALPGPKGLIVAYPHTSNWDFPIAMLAKWGLGWQIRFWGKDSLFKWPIFGRWLRWLGGIPVNRVSPQGLVDTTLAEVAESDFFWLGLAPEGTRGRGKGWRLGFYHVWVQTGLPLGVAVIDWREKCIGVKAFIEPTGDLVRDFDQIRHALGEPVGHTPNNASPVVPWSKTQSTGEPLESAPNN
ncbi:MAG: hypothetical protein RL357_1506 [Pseudomonadota bacterium]